MAWMSAGFGYLSLTATSRVSRKYGSWSIAQGMRQGMLDSVPKIWGKELEKEGAAWMEAKWIFPMLSLHARRTLRDRGGIGGTRSAHESLKPNVAFAWLMVICREILETLR